MYRGDTMNITEKIDKYLNETRINPSDKKTLQSYAIDIAKNVIDALPSINNKDLHMYIDRIMGFMGYDETNPNYTNTKRYMPKKYDKTLFKNDKTGDLNKVV